MDIISQELDIVKESLLTGRTLDEYLRDFDIGRDQLSLLETVLDLGSGVQQEFARDVKRTGLKTRVISIDPKLGLPEKIDLDPEWLSDDEIIKRRVGRTTPQEGTIAAVAQHIPLKSESVDAIFASRSVPMYIHDQTNMDIAISEMSRILKRGGEIRMFPVTSKTRPMVLNAVAKIPEIEIINHKHTLNDLQERLLIVRKNNPHLDTNPVF